MTIGPGTDEQNLLDVVATWHWESPLKRAEVSEKCEMSKIAQD